MRLNAVRTARLPIPRAPAPHAARASSHSRALAALAALALAAGLPAGLGACDPGPSAPPPAAAGSPVEVEASRSIEELRASFAPIPLTATSDKKNAWSDAKRKHLEELERGPRSLAPAALAAYERDADATDEWRSALLSVAAHADPELARPLLEKLSTRYDSGASLGVRTEALMLLARTSPASAVALFEPLLLDARPNATYPPKELMLRAWVLAARAAHAPADRTLATIATDLAQLPETRYVAVEELGAEKDSVVGRRSLETVLVESSSDGHLRRKAAQALRTSAPRAEFCAVLGRVAERESDQSFLVFLADMLQKNCP